MNTKAITVLNLLGFVIAASLYVMLLFMVARSSSMRRKKISELLLPSNRLLIIASLLGFGWNLGAFTWLGLAKLGQTNPSPLLVATGFTLLGFLPAVVVHATLNSEDIRASWLTRLISLLAYGLSSLISLIHFYSAFFNKAAPSEVGLQALTFGFAAILLILLVLTKKQPNKKRAVWVVALVVFTISALHLSQHEEGDLPWFIEAISNQASLPLALAILYQDYRFALADIFLKRLIAFVLLASLTFSAYILSAPILLIRDSKGEMSAQAVAIMLTLWILSVIIYPTLIQISDWFVDKVILQRTNYETLKIDIAKIVNHYDTIDPLLQSVCKKLSQAFTAREIRILISHSSQSVCDVALPHNHENQELTFQIVMTDFATKFSSISAFENNENSITTDRSQTVTATVFIPTTEHPHYLLVIGELGAGRRLLSDDITILEAIAVLIARRIDALRVNHERCERSLREQQMSKLATEAELRALRAQINPHFLFNALTTIGYLIQTAPDRAFDTLMRLTGLLRAVLRRSSGEFVTLGEEIDLIESYLEIEHARFEERLRTHIKVPEKLRSVRIPTLLIQPLVENAIKHGIGPKREGGDVTVKAEVGKEGFLQISVTDTGAGVSEIELARQRKRGVGLANVEQRLKGHYGEMASILFESASGKGTKVQLTLPLNSVEISEDFKKSLIKGV